MSLKKAYYYFYYQLYRFTNPSSIFPRQFVAILYLGILLIFIGASILYNYGTFIDLKFQIGDGKWATILYVGIICLPNFFIFEYKDQWKEIVNEFDKLPKKTNRIGSFIVWSIVILIIANFIFSIYLMDQNAKENHIGPYSKEYIEKQKVKDKKNGGW
ncbi:hypothetical protein [Flavobacterium chilense]|uniref:Uncharacterized protein n=1 Tax=Flavobacterium chilense TaxID=946677 RepID=A0A1M7ENR7_9FLAO|nr:hypothetical protein [Flavobacterium chilense]SHL93350.1 hypothetical protein SAMN05444484_1039 [Flavobacterium chilense]